MITASHGASMQSTAFTKPKPPHAKPEPVLGGPNSAGGNALRFWLPLLAIVLVAGIMYATFAVSWVKFSRAEVFFAECAREMIVQNNMVTPLYHGQPFFDKPIWSYWLIISMFKMFGVSHWAARVPSIVASIFTIASTAIVTRWVGTKAGASPEQASAAGLVSAMLLAGSFMFFSFSYLCMSDMTLVLCDVGTLALAYYGIVNQQRRTLAWWLASISMGFAFITKGPVGVVLPVGAVVAYLGVTRQLRFIKPLHLVLAAITATVIAFPWFFAAYKANGSWALAYFFIRENLVRYAGSMYDTHKPIWFMLTSLALGFLPWTPLIPLAFINQLPEMKARFSRFLNDPKLFMWIWVALELAFFSFSRGKCDYYALPVYPAVASLVALYLVDKRTTGLQQKIVTGMAVTALLAGLASPFLLYQFSMHAPFTSWWILPAALLGSGAVSLVACTNNRLTAGFSILFVGLCIALAGFAGQLFPVVMSAQSIDAYSDAVKASPPAMRLGVAGKLHHWVDELTFQSHREPTELADSAAVAKFFAAGPAMVLIPETAYHSALDAEPSLRNMDLKILDRRRVASHALTPGYVVGRGGNIFDDTLLLVSN
jgi:4-amino-4-deoxy-L-arabinose transferase-like glycosyltransferase